MKSSLSIALLVDAIRSRDRLNYVLNLALSFQQLGHHVDLFALVPEGINLSHDLSHLRNTNSVSLFLIPSHPCPFGPDDLIRQQIQELVDDLESRPLHYDVYHAQDIISASALALMQGLGFIDSFLYTVHDRDRSTETAPHLRPYQRRAVQTADRCLCFSDEQQQYLEDRFNARTLRLAAPALSRVQRRRRDALSQPGSSASASPAPCAEREQTAVQQHLALYWALYEKPPTRAVVVRYA
jgi:hypothetical protein